MKIKYFIVKLLNFIICFHSFTQVALKYQVAKVIKLKDYSKKKLHSKIHKR